MSHMKKIKHLLENIYGEKKAAEAFQKIAALIEAFEVQKKEKSSYFSEKDVVLILAGSKK